VGEDDKFNTTDVVTKTAKVIAIGPVNEYGKKYNQVKVGSVIIFDAYVGIPMNATDVDEAAKYKIIFSNDVLGIIN
jgi:co-chaperonin GroES (HSP10)